MESKLELAPLIVILGPTASGKSALGLMLAKKYGGEIICADSRTVYRGMDIGTAKPSSADRSEIPHHILDIVEPDSSFSAADFKSLAMKAIDEISAHGKLPIMVGGTGLYIDSVVFDFAFLPPVPLEEREQLQALNVEQLQKRLSDEGIPLPKNSRNPRHLIRAVETNGAVPIRKGIRNNTLIIGLDIDKETLQKRIEERVDVMIKTGFIEETNSLLARFGREAPGLQATGYKAFIGYASGEITLDQAKSAFIHNDMRLAKRQRTWFRRNPNIVWVKNSAEADAKIKKFLQQ